MKSRAADAARDTLHDSTPFGEPGSYTVFEARDRAAHTPSIAREIERQAHHGGQTEIAVFTDKERYLLDVSSARIWRRSIRTGRKAQWLRERARLADVNPDGPEARQIQEESRQAKLYADSPGRGQVGKPKRKRGTQERDTGTERQCG